MWAERRDLRIGAMTTTLIPRLADHQVPRRPSARSTRRDDGVRSHYDLSNEFYALWLDPSMTYSAAHWGDGIDSLDAAQQAKLDLIGRFAGLGDRSAVVGTLLDIGCGWGSMLDHARSAGVPHTMGVTLSVEQAAWARSRGHDVRVLDWRQLDLPAASVDAIVSIGSFEHIAAVGASAAGRAEAYAGFFQRCGSWLAPDGRLALQTITTGDATLSRAQQRDVLFLLREIFPYSRLPTLPEIMTAANGRLELVSARNDRLDYARTLQAWGERLGAERERAVELVGEEVTCRYERYLRVSAELFACGGMNLCRFAFCTPGAEEPSR
jgi:cyclopropane-fatty-acyl-phospholipid synthase